MRRTALGAAPCPVARSLDQIGDRWSLLIIRDALDGVRRFNEFQKHLGLARNILSSRLAKLVSHGILRLQPASDGSAYQEYVLTEKGESLRLVLNALHQWGGDFLFTLDEEPPPLVKKSTGERVARLEMTLPSGRVLHPSEVTVLRPESATGS
ncbi:transcriptional regulator [Streptomyces dengpaensis]|uniref:Transcriptional regulator n=1 Tax=Streptomyces dengpaensis TaxID=2049881 RepID=A0ABM6SK47_9ACTN|nr:MULTISPECIES: helix-turn-helix domain-containing protein [Streptomyces]AVH54758.1 transcriptional regulator [Streptomyces dengpaensis]PIB03832.1 transcriptional regulator [Streptomyces sp. HG99]